MVFMSPWQNALPQNPQKELGFQAGVIGSKPLGVQELKLGYPALLQRAEPKHLN